MSDLEKDDLMSAVLITSAREQTAELVAELASIGRALTHLRHKVASSRIGLASLTDS